MIDSFELRLLAVGKKAPCDERIVSAGNELAPVMSAICRWLGKHDVVQFVVNGFGQQGWPVDVVVDLAVVVEQIPSVLAGLLRDREVDLDFYEQGIQRLVTFAPTDGGEVRVSCRGGVGGWSPAPDEYVLKGRDVVSMLETFAQSFADIAIEACPGPASEKAFRAWYASLRDAIAGHNVATPCRRA
jgi:hypothetical protein